MKKILIIALIAIFACVSVFAEGYTFGLTYWAASDFFETIAQTVTDIAASNGDRTIVVDAQQDAQRQLNIIDDFIIRGVDAVFLNPVDKDAIRPALIALRNAGIPIINYDTAVEDLNLVQAFVASDNYGAGVICAEDLNKRLPEGGEIAILDYPANSACVERVQGFIDTINSNFIIVDQQDAQGKPDPGLEKTTDILTAHPNLVAIFCANDQCAMGAYGAVVAANKNVLIYGVDGAFESKEAIQRDSRFAGTAAQSPITMGAKSIEIAYEILNGEEYEREFAVPTFLITAENVEPYIGVWQ
ncbi:MAG TPA: sugar ABC transporter substrate-binding protein [Methanocorpusculum sp.]|nr:sugar ABC transporter substrate-binding protein [Methanocorpusculum sp.]